MDPKKEDLKVEPQAPAQGKPEEKKEEVKAQPSGLDALNADALRDLYKKSPQMFAEAGITKPEEKKEEKPVEEKKVETAKPESAAPLVLNGEEIKIPDDVPVDRAVIAAHLENAKANGLTAKQFQSQLDLQVNQYRESVKKQAPQKTTEQIIAEEDAVNVAKLKADKEFGKDFDANMDLARRAAKKWADPEVLEKLKTSDPVLVKHFYKLGKADAEDSTRSAPNRNGLEGKDAEETQQNHLRQRYKNSPQMFKD